MQTIQATEKTSSDGTLTLRLPLGRPDTEFDVVVIVQAKGANGTSTAENPFAVMDTIRNALAATGRDFGDSTDEIRKDRDR